MSRKTNNENIKYVQFKEVKGTKSYEALTFFEKIYPTPKRTDSIRSALLDLKTLYAFFNVRSFGGLLKKLNVQINKQVFFYNRTESKG